MKQPVQKITLTDKETLVYDIKPLWDYPALHV